MMMEPSELVQFSVECTALGAAAEEALAGAETARRAAHAACLARDAALESEREILRGVELVAADLGSGDAADGADEMKLKSFVSSALLDVMEEAARASAAAEAAADKFNAEAVKFRAEDKLKLNEDSPPDDDHHDTDEDEGCSFRWG